MSFVVQIIFILALTAIIIVGIVVKKDPGKNASTIGLDQRLADLEDKMEKMDRRLQNVETIATANNNLNAEFEALKD